MAQTIFEIRPEVEFEKDSTIIEVFDRKPRDFYSIKPAIDFCKCFKIVHMCYCTEYKLNDGEYETIMSLSVQEIVDFIEVKKLTPMYLTHI